MVQHNTIDHTGLTGVSTISYASNANQVGSLNYGGAAATQTRGDHIHLGVTSLSHTSNTFSGPVTLVAQGSLGITSPSSGTFAINAVAGSGGAAASTPPNAYESFLSAPVTIVNANTAYDGPTLSLPAGTYDVHAEASFSSANANATHLVVQIYDGTSVVATGAGYHGGGAGGQCHLSCSARITLAGTTTVKLQGISIRGTSDSAILNTEIANGTANKATSLRAIKVTGV